MSVLLSSLESGILSLTLNRPDKRNALNADLIEALHQALERADLDVGVRVVLLRGAGKDFCAGADLSMLEGMNKEYAKVFKEKGETAANQMLFDQSRRFSLVLRGIGPVETAEQARKALLTLNYTCLPYLLRPDARLAVLVLRPPGGDAAKARALVLPLSA